MCCVPRAVYGGSALEKLFSEDIEGKIWELENMSICQNVDKSDVDISGLYCIFYSNPETSLSRQPR